MLFADSISAATDAERTSINETVKSRCYDTSLISRLPVELLSLIFQFVKVDSGEFDGSTRRKICVSHVCSYWRSIALDSPRLWDEPPLDNYTWREEMLARSKKVGLTINATLRVNPESMQQTETTILAGLIEILHSHSSRIRDLSIIDIPPDQRNILDEMPTTAPLLETLWIDSLAEYDPTVPKPSIPVGVLINTPRLYSIKLRGIDAHWNHLDLRNLVDLTLKFLPVSARPGFAEAVEAFRTMPNLESLVIRDAFLPPRDLVVSNRLHLLFGIVDFPRLRKLFICSPADELQAFLQCVTFPATTKIRLSMECLRPDENNECTGILSLITRVYENVPSGQEFDTIVLDEGHGCSKIQLLGGKGRDTISVTMISSVALSNEFIGYIFNSAFRLDKISHVKISYESSVSFQTLAYLQTVSSLTAYNYCYTSTLVNALVPFPKTVGDTEEKATSPFPNLKSICFVGLIVNPFDKDNATIDQIKDTLVQRDKCGTRIDKVAFQKGWGLYRDDVARLADIVGDIQWDGMERKFTWLTYHEHQPPMWKWDTHTE